EWDFDGGRAIPGFGRGPHKVRWSSSGVKIVRLRVVEAGCTSATSERRVDVGTPDANFFAPDAACLDSFVVVRYTGAEAGARVAFVWDFDGGYGEPGYGPGPHRVRWTNPGTKIVRLRVMRDACPSLLQERKVEVRTPPQIVLEHVAEDYRAPTTVDFRVRGGYGNAEYFWDLGDGEQKTDLPYAQKTYRQSGRYPVKIRLRTEEGCESSDADTIWIRPAAPGIPSAFSPNGDGINDVLEIKNLSVYQSVHMTIYARWGMPVFETRRADEFWDGKNAKGVPVPEGVYAYRFQAFLPNGDPVEVYGTVTLIR
ncbi:MAG: gliding motility-associated C-terminal domain-containing protein, partial [Bacteroidia bacterium]|nr:gliding motility-associated C-terminal domain-containing protein [Bacteroidia bacterium]